MKASVDCSFLHH